jgi:hypothetical protein
MPVSSSPLPQRSTTDRSAGVGRAAPGWMCPVQGAEPGEPGEPWELRSASKITQKLINMVVQWLYNGCTMLYNVVQWSHGADSAGGTLT